MKTSLQFWKEAEQRSFDINRTFLEMQAGGNPLTNDEIDRLAEKRPEVWARFRGRGGVMIPLSELEEAERTEGDFFQEWLDEVAELIWRFLDCEPDFIEPMCFAHDYYERGTTPRNYVASVVIPMLGQENGEDFIDDLIGNNILWRTQ